MAWQFLLEFIYSLQVVKHHKDGLYQYRQLTAQTAVGSLETVIRHFIATALKRVTEAKAAVAGPVDEVQKALPPIFLALCSF